MGGSIERASLAKSNMCMCFILLAAVAEYILWVGRNEGQWEDIRVVPAGPETRSALRSRKRHLTCSFNMLLARLPEIRGTASCADDRSPPERLFEKHFFKLKLQFNKLLFGFIKLVDLDLLNCSSCQFLT